MYSHVRTLVLLGAVAMLVGCGAIPKQDFNAAANTHIKKIVVVTGTEPDEYLVQLVNHPGGSFGLIGGLVAAADMASKSSTFTAAAKPKAPGIFSVMEQELATLSSDGPYELEIAGVRQGDNSKFLEDYKGVAGDADAVLDIRLKIIGYRALYPTSPYVPTVMATSQLVDVKTNQVLYEATVHYGEPWIKRDGLVQIDNDSSYAFNDFDALTSDVDRATEGMVVGAKAVADRIKADLE